MGKRLELVDRLNISRYLGLGWTQEQIAQKLGVARVTITTEVKRGRNPDKDNFYDPLYAQRSIEQRSEARPAHLRTKPSVLENYPECAEYIAHLILDEGMNVPQVIENLDTHPEFAGVVSCTRTLYRSIEEGFIPGVTRQNLPGRKLSDYGVYGAAKSVYIPHKCRRAANLKEGDKFSIEVLGEGKLLLTRIAEA